MIRAKIVEKAYEYEGKKELKGNSGFVDKVFEKKMQSVGFNKGQAWCSYFAELVWCEGYGELNSSFITELTKLFSANAVKTFNDLMFKGYKYSTTPQPGDLVIWKSFKNGNPKKNGKWFLGHIGIVTKPADLFFLSMEGNTNSNGGREGIEVAEKKRHYDFSQDNGLRLLGFISPKEV